MKAITIYEDQLQEITAQLKAVNDLWKLQFSSKITLEFPDEFPVTTFDSEPLGKFVNDIGDEWSFQAALVEDS